MCDKCIPSNTAPVLTIDTNTSDATILHNSYGGIVCGALCQKCGQLYFVREGEENKCPNGCIADTPKDTNKMQTLTSALKRVLSKSLQAQYRAGLRNGELELTEKGRNELLEILAVEKEKELTEVAKEIIAEEEKKSK